MNFGNDFARNIVIFDVDNISSSHADSHNNNFLVLDDGPTYGISGSFGEPEKKFSIDFSKENTKLCLSLYYNGDDSYFSVNGKEIFMFKANNGTFQLNFV